MGIPNSMRILYRIHTHKTSKQTLENNMGEMILWMPEEKLERPSVPIGVRSREIWRFLRFSR
jgi:hypothetical protein